MESLLHPQGHRYLKSIPSANPSLFFLENHPSMQGHHFLSQNIVKGKYYERIQYDIVVSVVLA